MKRLCLLTFFCLTAVAQAQDISDSNWPQAAGPNLNWTVTTDAPVPTQWSAEKNENIRWRVSLAETGQSGIAVWEGRLFLTTMKPLAADAEEKTGTDIVIYCIDANDGSIRWQHDLGQSVSLFHLHVRKGASDRWPSGNVRRKPRSFR